MLALATGLGIALAALLVVLVTFATRGTPVSRVRRAGKARPDDLSETCQAIAKLSLSRGHTVRLLLNGDETFPALFEAISGARTSINWHVFWFKPGRLADEVAERLAARARAGVEVLMLLDHYGAKGLGSDYRRRLERAGVEVGIFRTLRWNTLYKWQQRSHTRTVIVDGRTGFTGGFGIDDRWLGGGRAPDQWRDTSVRVEGPAVAQLQGAFAANWAEARRELLFGAERYRAGDPREDGIAAGLLHSAPSMGSTSAERFFAATFAGARDRLYISSAYLVPDRHLRGLLCDAAARGVDVRVLSPGRNTDRPMTWHAARNVYDELLTAGVRIYEYRPGMMHAKTIVVDGSWCSVGTLNVDNRSMVLNDEVALVAHDAGLATQVEAAFLEDLRHSEEAVLVTHRARGSGARVLEAAAHLVRRLL